MNTENTYSLKNFLWQVTALHMITYFIAGIIAYTMFNYGELYTTTELSALMRPTNSPWVALGPGLQFIRGIIFALVLWPFRNVFLNKEYGWVKLMGLLVGIGIISTYGPSPGSIEGIIYTKLPISLHAIGFPEVFLQAAVFSYLLVKWYHYPARWKNIVALVLIAIMMFFSLMGALAAMGIISQSAAA